jgi:tRNA nucleotidyltransferase/poly(A) polymerase
MTLALEDKIFKELSLLAGDHSIQLYVVGGYVRDKLLSRERTDLDFTVVGDAINFAEKTAAHFNSKAVIYERFRTALVPVGQHHLEFVGTRKEEYKSNSRKPLVTEGTLEDDLRRRDFTVNAMAASLNRENFGEVIDLFDGMSDLQDKILRTPLEPKITFSDDPLRMMRAARFASQLQFQIDSVALDAVSKMCDRISIVSQERITDEFLKILASSCFP